MIAMCGGRAGGQGQRRAGLASRVLSCCARGACYVSLIGTAVACSEGQYNPPIGGNMSAQAGSAGQTGSGGSAGSGTSGAGGSAGTTGGAGTAGNGSGTATQVYNFGSSLEGFAINYYCLGPVANTNCPDMQAPPPVAAGDAGADATAPEGPPPNDFYTLEQDGTVGEATVGSAKLSLNFTTGTQSANFAINYGSGTAPGIDLRGKTVRAQVRVEPGAPPTTYAKMYIKTGSTYYYADSGQVTLVPSTWVSVSFSTATPPSYPMPTDAALYLLEDVREIGLEIAATGIAAATTAVIHIDTVSY
jgi:hypothetical protein